MHYALIDESGRLADPNDKIIVFAALITESLVSLDKIIPQIKKKLPVRGKRRKEKTLAEIKFSTTGEKTRLQTLKLIAEKNFKIFILVIDKEGRKIVDDPINYSFLIAALLKPAIGKFFDLSHLIIDKHFTQILQREKFNDLVQKKLGKRLFIEHLDSQQNTIVSLPDFVAGSVREAFTKENFEYKKIIQKLIVVEKKISWRKLAQQKR
ncbi:DUF3800 domain-containing protein [Candidatus Gottesmanbacteria bacterium]|nr:DUF3800 domain-containing protein [Candidatus Gottesmanbacteria bacterium]